MPLPWNSKGETMSDPDILLYAVRLHARQDVEAVLNAKPEPIILAAIAARMRATFEELAAASREPQRASTAREIQTLATNQADTAEAAAALAERIPFPPESLADFRELRRDAARLANGDSPGPDTTPQTIEPEPEPAPWPRVPILPPPRGR